MKKTAIVIIERLKAPTPKFWKKTRNYMLAIGGASAIVILGGSFLPLLLVKLASYGATTGAIGTALSQLAKVKDEDVETPIEVVNKTTKIEIISYKDTGLAEVIHDLGLQDEEYDIFEYGEYLNATLIVDKDLNIIGGQINRHKEKN